MKRGWMIGSSIDVRRLTALMALIAVAVLAALTTGQPAGAQVVQDNWSGKWKYTADGGQTYGTLKLNLDEDDDKTIHGKYTGETNGKLTAKLNRKFGATACGNFLDTSGRNSNKGKFCMFLQTDLVSFDGWYKPCRLLCFRQDWTGEKL